MSGQRQRRARLTVELPARVRARVDTIKERAQAATLSAVVERAIIFYRWVREHMPERDGTLEIRRPDGTTKASVPTEFL